MSIEKFIEDQISRAMADGGFDNLPGAGQPLDLNAYFQTPENLRLCYSMLKSGDFTPPEVELLKEIDGLRRQLDSTRDEDQKKRLGKTIADKTLTVKLLLENQRPPK